MRFGQVVYTVNAKTNSIDEWLYNAMLPTQQGILLHLTNRKKYCMLPANCVFEDKTQALKVLNKK